MRAIPKHAYRVRERQHFDTPMEYFYSRGYFHRYAQEVAMEQFLIGARTKIAAARYLLFYGAQRLAHSFIPCWISSAWNASRLPVHRISVHMGQHYYQLCTWQPVLFVCLSGTQDTPARASGATLLNVHMLMPGIQKQQYPRRNVLTIHGPLPHAHISLPSGVPGSTTDAQLSYRRMLPVQHFITTSQFCFLYEGMYT